MLVKLQDMIEEHQSCLMQQSALHKDDHRIEKKPLNLPALRTDSNHSLGYCPVDPESYPHSLPHIPHSRSPRLNPCFQQILDCCRCLHSRRRSRRLCL